MNKIFIDMDGVLADFDQGLYDKYGIKNCKVNYGTDWKDKTKEQTLLTNQVIWAMKQPGFFAELPLMPGAKELWEAAGPDCIVLTALPEFSHDCQVEVEKRMWLRNVFGPVSDDRVIVCLRKDKAKYARDSNTRESNILIDDLERNVQEWEKAFGIGILYKNAKQSINALNNLNSKRYDVV
jgi:5'(3')-deoxyribonucleotidase